MWIELIDFVFKKLPSVRNKDANLAAIIGFLFGGVGLSIYFRSIMELFLPLFISIVAMSFVGETGWLSGALFASIWGYFRVVCSKKNFIKNKLKE